MSKTCPNCGVNSPDNAKHCIECGESIEDVPINKEEKPKAQNTSDNGGLNLGIIVVIVIVLLVIIGVGSLVFNSGGDVEVQKNMSITFDDVSVHDYEYEGKTDYSYYVSGFFNNVPDNTDGYMIKTIYYDADGNEVTSNTNKLSYYEEYINDDYSTFISSYYSETYVEIDHVTVQVIKDNVVIDEFTSKMNSHGLTSQGTSSNSTNST